MKRLRICASLLILLFAALPLSSASALVVVRAVLFYSPSCGHCHYVITEVLPPLYTQYGNQLEIIGIDITQPAGYEIFSAALQRFNIENGGVPFLVIGDTYLIGSADIPEQFPTLIKQHLAQGGVDWPDISGLAEMIAVARATQSAASPSSSPIPTESSVTVAPTSVPATQVAPTPTPGLLGVEQTGGVKATFTRDLLGNSLSVIVLIGMIVVFVASTLSLWRALRSETPVRTANRSWGWAIPGLCLVGLVVAGYLAYVEMTQAQAVCGPVGDCNTVQQSEYARLFGILPIGILGVSGYVMILAAWAIGHFSDQRLAAYASLAQLGMTAFGMLFSIYLTFLEPFVIGATCAWCLTSAIIMTALLWLSLGTARTALSYLPDGEKYGFSRSNPQRSL